MLFFLFISCQVWPSAAELWHYNCLSNFIVKGKSPLDLFYRYTINITMDTGDKGKCYIFVVQICCWKFIYFTSSKSENCDNAGTTETVTVVVFVTPLWMNWLRLLCGKYRGQGSCTVHVGQVQTEQRKQILKKSASNNILIDFLLRRNSVQQWYCISSTVLT